MAVWLSEGIEDETGRRRRRRRRSRLWLRWREGRSRSWRNRTHTEEIWDTANRRGKRRTGGTRGELARRAKQEERRGGETRERKRERVMSPRNEKLESKEE